MTKSDKTTLAPHLGRLVATGINAVTQYELRRIRPITSYGLQYALWAKPHESVMGRKTDDNDWYLVAIVANANSAYKIAEAAKTIWTNHETS